MTFPKANSLKQAKHSSQKTWSALAAFLCVLQCTYRSKSAKSQPEARIDSQVEKGKAREVPKKWHFCHRILEYA